jgi:hypothetical protein
MSKKLVVDTSWGGWECQNMADWGSGRIEISKVAIKTERVEFDHNGKAMVAYVPLERASWPLAGSKEIWDGQYVAMSGSPMVFAVEEGDKEFPVPGFKFDSIEIV